jgi:hypothetical protein
MLAEGTGFYVKLLASRMETLRQSNFTDLDLVSGALQVVSYARPGKLLTANRNLTVAQVALLKPELFKKVVEAIVDILHASLHDGFERSEVPNKLLQPKTCWRSFGRLSFFVSGHQAVESRNQTKGGHQPCLSS